MLAHPTAKAVTRAIQYLGCSIPLGPWRSASICLFYRDDTNSKYEDHTAKSSKSLPEPPDLMDTYNPLFSHSPSPDACLRDNDWDANAMVCEAGLSLSQSTS